MKISDIPFGIIDWDTVDVTEQAGIEGHDYRKTVQVGNISMQQVEPDACRDSNHDVYDRKQGSQVPDGPYPSLHGGGGERRDRRERDPQHLVTQMSRA